MGAEIITHIYRTGLRVIWGQLGVSLIETLVGLAIIAAIFVAMMNGLSTGYRSLDTSQERTFAESLAKSQVEYILDQDYISILNYDAGDPAKRYTAIDIPTNLVATGYAVEISPPELIGAAGISGYELQSVTIQVKRHNGRKLIITFYRTGLAL